MRIKTQFLLIVPIALFITSCATTTGINKLGPDTYTLSARYSIARGAGDEAERQVLSSANQYCESMGKEVLVQSSERPDLLSYSAVFQCLNRKDSGLRRPHYEQAPSLVVKNIIQKN